MQIILIGNASARTLTGYATYYNLVGQKTASGQLFDPDSNNAAMYRPGIIHMGDTVSVQLQSNPSSAISVNINDTGRLREGPTGKRFSPYSRIRTLLLISRHRPSKIWLEV